MNKKYRVEEIMNMYLKTLGLKVVEKQKEIREDMGSSLSMRYLDSVQRRRVDNGTK